MSEPGSPSSSSSSSSPQARVRDRACPVSGCTPSISSPFHFGASPPAPTLLSSRRGVSRFPAPMATADEGSGLPMLTHPRVGTSKAV